MDQVVTIPKNVNHEFEAENLGKKFSLNVCWMNSVDENNEIFLQNANVFMVVFATDDMESIEKWKSIITEKNSQAPIIFVARPDCQEPSELVKLDLASGYQMAADLGAASFHMCCIKGASDDEIHEEIKKPFIAAVTLSTLAARIISEGGCSRVKMNDMSLNVFPAFVSHLKNLTELELMRNQIKDLSCQQLKHGGFDGLTSLDISRNSLAGLTPLIGRLQHLSKLNLAHNQLTFLPKALCDCHSLKNLNVFGNKIDGLPTSLYMCKKLTRLDLRNNPLNALLKELQLRSGPNSAHHTAELGKLLKYLEAMDKGGEIKVSRVKLMFVGDGNVGKTSLRYLLKHGKPKEKEFSVATDGVDIEEFEYGPIKYDCWDFAGQVLYYTTHQFFLTPRAVYLVMFNMAALNHTKVDYWLKSIRLKARNSPIILVGTHSDECTEEQIQSIIKEYKSRFRKYSIHSTIHSISAIHVNSSFHNLISNGDCYAYPSEIKALLDDLNDVTTKRRMVDKLMPTSYYYMIQYLKDRASTTPFVAVSEIKDSMEKLGISSDHHLNCIEILHDMGYILYYSEDEKLKDLIILDPQFLTLLMSTVVSYKNQWVKQGHISAEDLADLIKNFCLPWEKKITIEDDVETTVGDKPKNVRKLEDQFLHLLERFEVIYRLSTKQYIVPCMLDPEAPPNFTKYQNTIPVNSHEFRREYVFSFVPIGFFSRVITRVMSMSNLVTSNLWEYGLCLAKEDGQTASLVYDPVEYILNVRARAPIVSSPKSYLLTDLLESIDSLIHVFYAADAHRMEIYIPYSLPGKEPIHIKPKYNEVVDQALKNQFIEFEGHKIDLLLLAPDIGLVHTMSLKNVKVTKQLGEGGFGIVYKGLLNDNVDVAIKELKMSTLDGGVLDKFKEFMHEVNLMSRFDSPYLVHLFGTSLSPLGMVMEFCPFQSLDTHLSNKQFNFPWKLRCKIAYDITKALSILHSHHPPVMHRDLRSPNVFIVSTDLDVEINAKIGDFGLAQYTLPHLNELLACWQWLAPEVFDPKSPSYDEFSDIYSLGMVLWELATRQIPFSEFHKYIQVTKESLTEEMLSSDEVLEQLKSSGYEIVGSTAVKEQYNVQSIKEAILNEDLRPTLPSEGVPKFFLKVITLCWNKDPQKRPVLSRLLEVFSSKLAKLNWSNIDNPLPRKSTSKKTFDQTDITIDLLSPNARSHPLFREYPIKITILSLSVQDLKINGRQIMLRIRFRGKTFETPKRKVPNQKNQLVHAEWDKESLSKFSFDAMNSSMLTVEVMDGTFRFCFNSKVGVFLGCYIRKAEVNGEMFQDINTLALTDIKGKQNGTLNMSFTFSK